MSFTYIVAPILYQYFFFYSYADHRDLHSFPTRRSSDLAWTGPCAPTSSPRAARRWRWPAMWTPCCRSEEHTSELQSRLHLVCRLLLEKKKKLKQTRP